MPKDLVASFATYNISRSYKMSVEMKLGIAGRETVSLEPAVFEVNVLSDTMARPALPVTSSSLPVPGYDGKNLGQQSSAVKVGEVPAYDTVVDDKERLRQVLGDDVKSPEGPRSHQPPKDEDEDDLPAYSP